MEYYLGVYEFFCSTLTLPRLRREFRALRLLCVWSLAAEGALPLHRATVQLRVGVWVCECDRGNSAALCGCARVSSMHRMLSQNLRPAAARR